MVNITLSEAGAFPRRKKSNPPMPKIFDCFTFFNELDLLEIRLSELHDVVDYFVIVESEETFTGLQKGFNLESNYERYSRFHSKMIYIKMTKMDAAPNGWAREHAQRERLFCGLRDTEEKDVVILSDVDEVISADAVKRIRENPPAPGEIYCLEQRYFHYFLNLELPLTWLRTSPRAIQFGSLKNMRGLRSVRPPHKKRFRDIIRGIKAAAKMHRTVKRTVIPDAGWHFSWLGGDETVAEKARSISFHSGRPDDYGTLSGAERMKREAIERFRFRNIDKSFPDAIVNGQERYNHLILRG